MIDVEVGLSVTAEIGVVRQDPELWASLLATQNEED